MRPITEVAEELGIEPKVIIPFGRYKAKVSLAALRHGGRRGKLVVTGMIPTHVGEIKTTTTVGLTQGLGRLGKRAVAKLREPSLGPIFGIKGGGTGGGMSRVEPEGEVNIHFIGDAHSLDGERYDVAGGEWIRLVSRRGELVGRALYTEKMRTGEVFVPFLKLRDHAANFLTNSVYDPTSRIPEYKVSAVRIEKTVEKGSRGHRRTRGKVKVSRVRLLARNTADRL